MTNNAFATTMGDLTDTLLGLKQPAPVIVTQKGVMIYIEGRPGSSALKLYRALWQQMQQITRMKPRLDHLPQIVYVSPKELRRVTGSNIYGTSLMDDDTILMRHPEYMEEDGHSLSTLAHEMVHILQQRIQPGYIDWVFTNKDLHGLLSIEREAFSAEWQWQETRPDRDDIRRAMWKHIPESLESLLQQATEQYTDHMLRKGWGFESPPNPSKITLF